MHLSDPLSTALLFGLFVIVAVLVRGKSTHLGFTRLGKSRLWTFFSWQKSTRFDLPRYAKIGYEKVRPHPIHVDY